jgi:hypothetical protein
MSMCTAMHWCECRCKALRDGAIFGMYHTEAATYYPCLGMFREGRRLIPNVGCWWIGQHAWHTIVHLPESNGLTSRVFEKNGITKTYEMKVKFHRVIDGQVESWIYWMKMNPIMKNGRFIMGYLWRIQRAVRRFLQRRRWARQARVAVGMALNPRLGSKSLLHGLPAELVWRCCKYVV